MDFSKPKVLIDLDEYNYLKDINNSFDITTLKESDKLNISLEILENTILDTISHQNRNILILLRSQWYIAYKDLIENNK